MTIPRLKLIKPGALERIFEQHSVCTHKEKTGLLMGIFNTGIFKNPFRGRQPGVGAASTGVKVKGEKFSVKEANNIVTDVYHILKKKPDITDGELMRVLNLPDLPNYQACVATGRAAYEKEQLLSRAEPTTGPLGNGPASDSQTPFQQGGDLNLINYRPEEVIQQVNESLNDVQFGMSKSRRYMHAIGDIWANIAPWVLCIGTVGEVFAFLWMSITPTSTVIKDGKVITLTHDPVWWVIVSLLATIVAMEATFAVVSFKAAAIRADAEHKPGGPTREDKKMISGYRIFWIVLAVFVSAGQVAFLVTSSTQNFTTGTTIFFIVFAVLRTVGTMVGDYYTAFFHKETPDDGQQKQESQAQRARLAAQLLEQKNQEIAIVNAGVQSVMRAQSKAKEEQDDLRTQLALRKAENQNRIDTMQSQAENARLFTRMGNNLIRAIFDDQLPDEDRRRILANIQGLLQMNRNLPHYKIEEEDD